MADIRAGTVVFDIRASTRSFTPAMQAARRQVDLLTDRVEALQAKLAGLGVSGLGGAAAATQAASRASTAQTNATKAQTAAVQDATKVNKDAIATSRNVSKAKTTEGASIAQVAKQTNAATRATKEHTNAVRENGRVTERVLRARNALGRFIVRGFVGPPITPAQLRSNRALQQPRGPGGVFLSRESIEVERRRAAIAQRNAADVDRALAPLRAVRLRNLTTGIDPYFAQSLLRGTGIARFGPTSSALSPAAVTQALGTARTRALPGGAVAVPRAAPAADIGQQLPQELSDAPLREAARQRDVDRVNQALARQTNAAQAARERARGQQLAAGTVPPRIVGRRTSLQEAQAAQFAERQVRSILSSAAITQAAANIASNASVASAASEAADRASRRARLSYSQILRGDIEGPFTALPPGYRAGIGGPAAQTRAVQDALAGQTRGGGRRGGFSRIFGFGGPLGPSVAGFGVPPGAVGGASLLAGGFIGITAIAALARGVGRYAEAWQELQNDLGNFQTNLTSFQGTLRGVDNSLRDGLGSIIDFVAGSRSLSESFGNLGASIGELLDETSPAGQRFREFGTAGAGAAAGAINFLGGTGDRLANTVGAAGVGLTAAAGGFAANIIARPIAVGVGLVSRALSLLPGPLGLVGRGLRVVAEISPSLATAFGTLAPFSENLRNSFGNLGRALGINIQNLTEFGRVLLIGAEGIVGAIASMVNAAREVLGLGTAAPATLRQAGASRQAADVRASFARGALGAFRDAPRPDRPTGIRAIGAAALEVLGLSARGTDITPFTEEVREATKAADAAAFRFRALTLETGRVAEAARDARAAEAARRRAVEEARSRSVRGAQTAAVRAGEAGERVIADAAAILSRREPTRLPRGSIFPGENTRGGIPTDIGQVIEEIAGITALQEREPGRSRILSGRLRDLEAARDADRDLIARQAALESQVDLDAFGGFDQATTDARALRAALEELNAAALEINQSIATSGTNALLQWAQGAISASEAFKQFAISVVADIARIVVQQSILNSIGGSGGTGGVGGFFAAIFNPGTAAAAGRRQLGGPVTAGRSYLVGEAGPELFRASQSGEIVSNASLRAGGGGTTIVNNWYSNDTTTARAAFKEFEPDLLRQARVQALQDNRRPGLR